MNHIEITSLEANFSNWRATRAPEENEADAFEIYTIEQILKDRDLSDDEIQAGNFGGGDDGGVDGMYFFINRTLILEETPIPEPATSVELIIIQSKRKKGFEETAIQKFRDFAQDCLDWSKPTDSIKYLSIDAKEGIDRFRDRLTKVLGDAPKIRIAFHYATKAATVPHPKVLERVENLKSYVQSQLSSSQFAFIFWDCAKLLQSVRTIPSETMVIPTSKLFSTNDKCIVCLVLLSEFAAFLTDENNQLKTCLLEPNVRDFQGPSNTVNTDIRSTLDSTNVAPDFWWLNNGITIIAEDCFIAGDKVTITRPEIVNGLQTSHEVFESFKRNPGKVDKRNILVKIIVTKDESSRNMVIKTTNNQTPVSALSLRSMDKIHFDIQDMLKLHGFFYDRRKGENKRRNKPINKIISPMSLAQSVMAVYLKRPSDARGRPETVLKVKSEYAKIFNDSYDKVFYVACVVLRLRTLSFMNTAVPEKDVRARLCYPVAMMAACEFFQKANPSVDQIATLATKNIDNSIFEKCLGIVKKMYDVEPTDRFAKGTDFQEELVKNLKTRFPNG